MNVVPSLLFLSFALLIIAGYYYYWLTSNRTPTQKITHLFLYNLPGFVHPIGYKSTHKAKGELKIFLLGNFLKITRK